MKLCSGELSSVYVSIIMMPFKQACYTATRLENISLFLADRDRSNLKESRNICCNACLQEREGSRGWGGGGQAGPISRRDNGSTCWCVWKLGWWENNRNNQDGSRVKFTTGVNAPSPPSLPPPLLPPSPSPTFLLHSSFLLSYLPLPLPLLPSSSLYRGWRSFALPSLFLAEVAVAPVIFLKIIMAFTKPFFPSGTLPGFPGPSPLLSVSQTSPPPPLRAPFSQQQSLVVK